jgi:hypothetical protein
LRRNQLLAAGVSVALLLGAATPALAKPNKGKALGHQNNTPADSRPAKGPKPAKPKPKPAKKAKKTKSGVSGGGVVNGAEFSIQARLRDIRQPSTSTTRGHFNYTDATTKIRCRGFQTFTVPTPATGQPVSVTFNNCRVNDQPLAAPGQVVVTVTDNGQPQPLATPPVADHIEFSVGTTVSVNSALTDGNVKVR